MLKKISIFFLFVVVLVLLLLKPAESGVEVTAEDKLLFALQHHSPDLEFGNLNFVYSENRVETVTRLDHNLHEDTIDSLAYHEYSEDGRILEKTTGEWMRNEYLPFTAKYVYDYSGDKVVAVTNYIFTENSRSVTEKWFEDNFNNLQKFSVQKYSYSGDTLWVDCGHTLFTYIYTHDGKPAERRSVTKEKGRYSISRFVYGDGNVMASFTDSLSGDEYKIMYEYKDNTVVSTHISGDTEVAHSEMRFNEKGLPEEVLKYENDKPVTKKFFHYTYY